MTAFADADGQRCSGAVGGKGVACPGQRQELLFLRTQCRVEQDQPAQADAAVACGTVRRYVLLRKRTCWDTT